MSMIKIQEAKNGAAQLSQGRIFLMVNKFKIKRGANIGQGLIVVRINELVPQSTTPNVPSFQEIKSFLLSEKQYSDWIALLIQVGDKKLEDTEESEAHA